MSTIFAKTKQRDEIEQLIRALPAILSGRAPDQFGIAHGFKLRMAVMFFSNVKEAFIIKARGGTDVAGISWPPLTKKYLAYGRGPKSSRTAGGLSPGGKDGFMSETQLKNWKKDFVRALAWLSGKIGAGQEAKSGAAAIAWVKAKARGVRTILDVFGNREVEILRDRGILFNSFSPGILSERGPDASYSPPEDQVLEEQPGSLTVGTSVEYAKHHQDGKRPFWPQDGSIPQEWVDDMVEVGISGLLEIGSILNN